MAHAEDTKTQKGAEERESINLLEYYHLLLRRKWTILLSLALVMVVVFWQNSKIVPIYRSTATMIIDRESNISPITGRRTGFESYMSEAMAFNTHFNLITSRPVMEKVVKRLGLDEEPEESEQPQAVPPNPLIRLFNRFKENIALLLENDGDEEPPEEIDRMTALIGFVKGMVSVEPVEETRLMLVSAVSTSPEMAMKVAENTAEAYIDFNIQNRMETTQNTLNWLTENLYEMKKRLEDAEQEFQAYKREAGLISMEDSQQEIAQKIRDFNNTYVETRNKRLEVNAKLNQLQKIARMGRGMPNLRALVDNELVSALYGQLVDAEVELSKLSKVYKSKHPKIVQVNTKIEKTRKKLRNELLKEIENLKAERSLLLSRENVLQKTMADFKNEAMNTNKKELRYTFLKRNVEMNQNLYDNLLARVKEAGLSGDMDVSNIRITEKAALPRAPINMNQKRNIMLGIVLGLMIGAGLAFLQEYIDRTIRTEEDIEKYLGLQVLSVVPMAEQATEKSYYGAREKRGADPKGKRNGK